MLGAIARARKLRFRPQNSGQPAATTGFMARPGQEIYGRDCPSLPAKPTRRAPPRIYSWGYGAIALVWFCHDLARGADVGRGARPLHLADAGGAALELLCRGLRPNPTEPTHRANHDCNQGAPTWRCLPHQHPPAPTWRWWGPSTPPKTSAATAAKPAAVAGSMAAACVALRWLPPPLLMLQRGLGGCSSAACCCCCCCCCGELGREACRTAAPRKKACRCCGVLGRACRTAAARMVCP